jgi:hypothetical protein
LNAKSTAPHDRREAALSTLAPLTQKTRASAIAHLMSELAKLGTPRTLDDVTAQDIESYIAAQCSAGMKARTAHNRLTHIRAGLRSVGRDLLAGSIQLSTRSLRPFEASRDGVHFIRHSDYAGVIERAQTLDPGFACALQLQRELGLRSTEVILCGPSLKSWAEDLKTKDRVQVTEGTKTKVPRVAITNNPYRALLAVKSAIEVVKRHGSLVPSQSLAGSKARYLRCCKAVGLAGVYACEALRVMYVQELFALHFQSIGLRQEALRATCADIGHSSADIRHIEKVFQL